MPGKLSEKTSRCRLEHALKTRTTLSSEFSSKIRGRNLALTCGAAKQVKTWYLKQQLAVKDMEADRYRLLGPLSKRKPPRRFSDDATLFHGAAVEELEVPNAEISNQKHQHHLMANSNIMLLERQLARQRQIHGFGKGAFRTINVYKIDKSSGEIVRSFDAMPVEHLFPSLTISGSNRRASFDVPTTSDARPSTDGTAFMLTQSHLMGTAESNETLSITSRQRARGEDKPDILVTTPASLTRTQTYLNGRMKSFIGELDRTTELLETTV